MIIVNRDSNQPKLSADTEIGGSLGSEAQETQLSLLKTTIADEIKVFPIVFQRCTGVMSRT